MSPRHLSKWSPILVLGIRMSRVRSRFLSFHPTLSVPGVHQSYDSPAYDSLPTPSGFGDYTFVPSRLQESRTLFDPGVRASRVHLSSHASNPVCPWHSRVSRPPASYSSCVVLSVVHQATVLGSARQFTYPYPPPTSDSLLTLSALAFLRLVSISLM
jgi:hypothetical protein